MGEKSHRVLVQPLSEFLRRLKLVLSRLPAIFAVALAGCATVADRSAFQLSADEVHSAWRRSLQPEEREAEQAGTYPPGMAGPFFSAASCRWIEPGRRATCRYRVSREPTRPGSERHWVDESADFRLSEDSWSFVG